MSREKFNPPTPFHQLWLYIHTHQHGADGGLFWARGELCEEELVEAAQHRLRTGQGRGHDRLIGHVRGDSDYRRLVAHQIQKEHPMTIDDWQRFTEDLRAHASVAAEFHPDPKPDGLHALQINEADFFFNADGSGYDGWGRRVSGPVKPERN